MGLLAKVYEGVVGLTLVDEKTMASILSLKPACLKAWRYARKIPYRKMGKAVRYEVGEVTRWADSKLVKPLA